MKVSKKEMSIETNCRSCGMRTLENIISFGKMPLANALLKRSELKAKETLYPLNLMFCSSCALVQIRETVAPEKLFSHYLYFSSFADTMLKHAEALSASLIASRKLGSKSLVVEIASNDGYLLKNFVKRQIPVLGIEPAKNIAKEAQKKGVKTVNEFFGESLARRLTSEGARADVVVALNVMAHVQDLNGFVNGIRLLLKEDGIAVIEVPYVKDLVNGAKFDTIYHEHLCYFSFLSLCHLFERHGLFIREVVRKDIHGGSLRMVVSKTQAVSTSAHRFFQAEKKAGMDKFIFYKRFAQAVKSVKKSLKGVLIKHKRSGKSLAAYGAGAKGVVLLNYCGIGKELLDFTVDRSTHKQGRFVPGVRLPIHAPSELLRRKPDYVLLLTWNFAKEILSQQRKFIQNGGRFVIPVPKVRVL